MNELKDRKGALTQEVTLKQLHAKFGGLGICADAILAVIAMNPFEDLGFEFNAREVVYSNKLNKLEVHQLDLIGSDSNTIQGQRRTLALQPKRIIQVHHHWMLLQYPSAL
eukprot:m.300620 g.300620  ORF g.300620 m.300620 type:complete len:110 (-) comp122946_c0_seq1:118-447(-)